MLSPDWLAKAAADTIRNFQRTFGGVVGEFSTSSLRANTKTVALPPETKGLTLPSIDLKQLGASFESSNSAFIQGVDKLVKTLLSSGTGGTTINLSTPTTVSAQGDRAIAQKTGESVQNVLGRVVGQAQGIAKSRR